MKFPRKDIVRVIAWIVSVIMISLGVCILYFAIINPCAKEEDFDRFLATKLKQLRVNEDGRLMALP